MSHAETAIKNITAASRRLAEADPQDEAVQRTIDELQSQVSLLNELARVDSGFGQDSMKDDAEFIGEQIKNLKAAASAPARNYAKIVSICDELREVVLASRRPENAAIRPKLATIVKQVAGVFSEVDTVDDLDKPLAQIEKAVHALYGDQSSNQSPYFERRNKGHHGKE
jgi:hypothetical protein